MKTGIWVSTGEQVGDKNALTIKNKFNVPRCETIARQLLPRGCRRSEGHGETRPTKCCIEVRLSCCILSQGRPARREVHDAVRLGYPSPVHTQCKVAPSHCNTRMVWRDIGHHFVPQVCSKSIPVSSTVRGLTRSWRRSSHHAPMVLLTRPWHLKRKQKETRAARGLEAGQTGACRSAASWRFLLTSAVLRRVVLPFNSVSQPSHQQCNSCLIFAVLLPKAQTPERVDISQKIQLSDMPADSPRCGRKTTGWVVGRLAWVPGNLT
jgi:hypothetical protein